MGVSTSYAECLDALGDPVRRAIVERLAGRPSGLDELTGALPVGRAALAEHLEVLVTTGLVLPRAGRSEPLYQLDLAGIGTLRTYLDGLWNQGLTALKHEAERSMDVPGEGS